MASLEPGAVVYVQYDDVIWHERVVLSWVENAEYVVIMPDSDVFIEQLDANNEDLAGLRFAPPEGGYPFGLAGASIYAFDPRSTGSQLASLLQEGAAFARTERQARGLIGEAGGGPPLVRGALPPVVVPIPLPALPIAVLPPGALPGALPPLPPPRAPRIAPAGGTWMLDEPCGDSVIGQEVVLPLNVLTCGGRAFVTVGGEVVTVRYLAAGTDIDAAAADRLAGLMRGDNRIICRLDPDQEITLAEADHRMRKDSQQQLKIRGPPTVQDSMRAVVGRTAGGYLAAHDRWVIEAKMDPGARTVFEHRVISKVIHFAIQEGLNIKSLTCFEYLNRRRQLLEVAHSEDPNKPVWEGARFVMGEDDESAGIQTAPSLRAHVASEFGKDAAIEKERTKARDAREGKKPPASADKSNAKK